MVRPDVFSFFFHVCAQEAHSSYKFSFFLLYCLILGLLANSLPLLAKIRGKKVREISKCSLFSITSIVQIKRFFWGFLFTT